jgi:hypothetical protein
LYADWQKWPLHALQVGGVLADEILTVGIPHTPRIARAAERAGATEVSWDRSVHGGRE